MPLFCSFRYLVSFGLLLAGVLLTSAFADDLQREYTWKPMRIGGGGWVVGMDIHPTEPGLMYARADVAGAYRWEPDTETWTQVVTARSLPDAYVGYSRYRGVDSLVAAPADPDMAYMAYEGEVFRSTDRGERWQATQLAPHAVKMEPNGEGRQDGERLSVDPHNSAVVYYGSIQDGLWRTMDGGENWSRVAAIPPGSYPHGVNAIIFDPASGEVEQGGVVCTRIVYVTTHGAGVFRSEDGGQSWANLSANTPLMSAGFWEAALGPDRTFYVTGDDEKNGRSALWKYSEGAGWKEVGPSPEQAGELQFWGFAVDPNDPLRLFLLCQGGQAFVSEDQGKTWDHRGFALGSHEINWLGRQQNDWLSIGECAFAPDGELWLAEGFGVWRTDSLSGPDINWQAASRGIEETCGNDVIAPPDGAPLGAVWDVGVFRFSDPDSYTAERGFVYFMSAWSLDWCPEEPGFIVGVFRNHLGFAPHINESGYSTDGGRSWTVFPALADGSAPRSLEYGVVAVSAANPDHIVWLSADNQVPHFTRDRGESWARASLEGADASGFSNYFGPGKPLCADRVKPDTFYLYLVDGRLYRSDDGGANFARVGDLVGRRYNSILKAAPGQAGHLWFAEGSQGTPVGGLWRSTDGGEAWVALPGVEQAFNFGFGKPLQPDAYPTLFVAGVVGGKTGIWRSTDEGHTWEQIGGYPLGIFDWIDAMDGDKTVFGKVYLAFASSGFAYGEPKP